LHPLDAKGKTPLNLDHGVLSPTVSSDLSGRRVITAESGEKWQALKSAPKDAFNNSLVASSPPERVSRTVLQGSSGTRVVSTNKDSSIAYDPKEHRFVNSNSSTNASSANGKERPAQRERANTPVSSDARNNVARVPSTTARNTTPPPPRNSVPPPVPRYSGGERSSFGGSSGGNWGGSRSSGASSAGGTTHSVPAPAPAPHVSSGGRPH